MSNIHCNIVPKLKIIGSVNGDVEKSIDKDIELAFKIKEDKKKEQCVFELATASQNKMKSYKKQIEDADEITALKLAIKFRKAQQEYEESEERAKLPENQLSPNDRGFF